MKNVKDRFLPSMCKNAEERIFLVRAEASKSNWFLIHPLENLSRSQFSGRKKAIEITQSRRHITDEERGRNNNDD
jgi:hypothetical protein